MKRRLDVVRLRLRSLFWRSAVDRDLDRELRFHIEQHVAERVAGGASPEEARVDALKTFGSPASVTEQCRETRRVNFVQNLAQDIRYALRTLVKQPALVVTAASSIAFGVGANLAIFGLANSLLLSTPSASRPDRLVHIRTNEGSHTSYSTWRELDASGVMDGIAGHQIETEINWRGRETSVPIMPLIVTANFFDVMGMPLAMGRAFTAAEAAAERDPKLAVVSHGFWRTRLGGEAAVLGSSLVLNGEPYGVVSFAVTRRTPEIGIRMALGSSRQAIALLVFTDGAVLVGAGMLIGLGVALVVTRPLSGFLVAELPTTDPASFVGTIGLLAATSLVAGWGPTRRAVRVDPAVTLRAE